MGTIEEDCALAEMILGYAKSMVLALLYNTFLSTWGQARARATLANIAWMRA